uniref:Uncharacterized protein n=1 Tax=Arundo donax TaxID=35708 RepID=A0A0A8YMK3_ARUDO
MGGCLWERTEERWVGG